MGIVFVVIALVVLAIGARRLSSAQKEASSKLKPGQNPNFWTKLDPDFYHPAARESLKAGWQGYQIMGLAMVGLGATQMLLDTGTSKPVAIVIALCGLFALVRAQLKISKVNRMSTQSSATA